MSGTKEERFTDAEITANLWIFNVGGYETTSNAMEFLVLALALHPQKQAWLRTELRKSLLPDDPARWEYEPTMAAFTAAICVVYEALRLFPTQPTILRWTEDQYLTVAGHIVPPNTAVQFSCTALHRKPKYWGREADEFVPDRWNGRNDNEDGEDAAKRRFPTVRSPPVKGAFLPWGECVRACLGRKFSEVERAAIIAVLFRDYEVEVERFKGVSREAAMERGWRSVDSATMRMAFTLTERVGLVWKRVEG
jgi:cytochrome P450